MSALPKVAPLPRPCPFCGVIDGVPHETQEGCIAALHNEIGRMRGILETLKPAGIPQLAEDTDEQTPATIRLSLD